MPLFRIRNRNVLFVHIPKTGGSTIEDWLKSVGEMSFFHDGKPPGLACPPQHIHAALLRDLGVLNLADYAFCVTRDPLERLLSEFFWAHRKRGQRLARRRWPWQTPEQALSAYFDKWCADQFSATASDPFHRGNHMRPQAEFCAFDGCVRFRLEDGMTQVTAAIAEALSIEPPSEPESRNAASRTPLRPLARTLRRIDDFYRHDFGYLGYPLASTRT